MEREEKLNYLKSFIVEKCVKSDNGRLVPSSK